MSEEELKAIEERDAEAPSEDELHERASDLEEVHGVGCSASVDEACDTLRAMATGRNDRAVPRLCAAVRERDATIAQLKSEHIDRVTEMTAMSLAMFEAAPGVRDIGEAIQFLFETFVRLDALFALAAVTQ